MRFLIVAILLLFRCDAPQPPGSIQPPAPSTGIVWDAKSLVLVAADAHYPRIKRLANGELLAGFSRGNAVWSSRSTDDGRTWEQVVRVGDYAKGSANNSELLQLTDGRVMYLFNERERHPTGEPDNGIAIAFSSDGGKSWGAPRRVYGGGPMWEPAAIEVGQELRIFFADEKPYTHSNEQQISMLTSVDNGATWTGPINVSFRPHHRDGMPVPAILSDGRLVIAIEDDGFNGTFKPMIVDLSDPAKFPIDANAPERTNRLAPPLAAATYAGAPYVVTIGKDHTVLSAQVEDANHKRHMTVWLGDAAAQRFADASEPFAGLAAPDDEELWCALLARDDHTVTAIAGTKINGVAGVWMINGVIHP